MGTTCEIARVKDGNVQRIHISYDGYLGGVGLELFKFYDTEEKVNALFGHGTGATSLEADPTEMSWSDWDYSFRGVPLEVYVADHKRTVRAFAMRPRDPSNARRLLDAIAETNPLYKVVANRTVALGEISPFTDIRDLPEVTRALVPEIVARLFAESTETYNWEHACGSLGQIADIFATPADFDFDQAWKDDGNVLGDFVWANGRWGYPSNVADLTSFISGDDNCAVTREMLIAEGNCEDADFVTDPARPFNERWGVLLLDKEGNACLREDDGKEWRLAGTTLDVLPMASMASKRVRVLFGNMMVSHSLGAGGSTSSSVAQVLKIDLVQ